MRIHLCLIFCLCFLATLRTAQAQTCNDHMAASTPNYQLVDNGNSTVTDSRTRLMWKKCVQGMSGNNCESGSATNFTWQGALQQPRLINTGSGFAGYHDWRLPNIKELRSIVEERCDPKINLARFPNALTDNVGCVWSGSPDSIPNNALFVCFCCGQTETTGREPYYGGNHQVRLVRGGQ